MLARVRSGALIGIDAVIVDVEVDMALGLPYFNVVGLPEGAVKESKVRVVSALKNTGFDLPQKRITVNLAPADIRKEGAAFELPIALGVLVASRFLDEEPLANFLFAGELSLDGAVKAIRGVLPFAIAARDGGFRGVMVPKFNAAEADGAQVQCGGSRSGRQNRCDSGFPPSGSGGPLERRVSLGVPPEGVVSTGCARRDFAGHDRRSRPG